jgi:hypothetical protein
MPLTPPTNFFLLTQHIMLYALTLVTEFCLTELCASGLDNRDWGRVEQKAGVIVRERVVGERDVRERDRGRRRDMLANSRISKSKACQPCLGILGISGRGGEGRGGAGIRNLALSGLVV